MSTGVNYLGKAIEEAAKETNDRVTAVRNVEVTNETFGPCVQVARGWFFQGLTNGNAPTNALKQAERNFSTARTNEGKKLDYLRDFWEKRMYMAKPPDFVFEAEIVPSSCEKVPPPPPPSDNKKTSKSQSADSGDEKGASSTANPGARKDVSSSGDTSGKKDVSSSGKPGDKKDGSPSGDTSGNKTSCANEQALAMVPTYAQLNEPISQAVLRPSKAREVAVFFSFADAGGNLSVVPEGPGAGIVLGRLEPDKELKFFEKSDPSTRSGTQNQTSGTQNQPRDAEINRGPLESRWFKVAVGETKKPMTVAALVTEHQDAQPFLQFVADVFNGAKPQITTALQTAVVPTMRAAAQESAQATKEKARTDYETALAAAFGAAKTCAAGVSDPLPTSTDVRGKVRALNLAARALNLAAPANGSNQYEDNKVPLSANASEVKNGCIALLDSLKNVL